MYPALELRLLRYVVAVAEELHFSRAALRVRVAQPSLSKQIRDLEEGLGVPLFNRSNRNVQLTQAGRSFVKEAIKALFYADRAVEVAKQADTAENGVLSIGYTPRINLRVVSSLRTLSALPRWGLKLAFVSLESHNQVQALLQGKLHAGLLTLPVKNESLIVKPLVREPLLVVMSAFHPLAGRDDVSAHELADVNVLSFQRDQHPGFHEHLLKQFRQVNYKPKVVQEISSETEALYMAKEGLGVAFVKRSAIPMVAPGLWYSRFADAALFEETGYAYHRDHRSPKLQELVTLLRSNAEEIVFRCAARHGDLTASCADPRQMRLF
jgi:DNA-binding transcriptional LysR family regulator